MATMQDFARFRKAGNGNPSPDGLKTHYSGYDVGLQKVSGKPTVVKPAAVVKLCTGTL